MHEGMYKQCTRAAAAQGPFGATVRLSHQRLSMHTPVHRHRPQHPAHGPRAWTTRRYLQECSCQKREKGHHNDATAQCSEEKAPDRRIRRHAACAYCCYATHSRGAPAQPCAANVIPFACMAIGCLALSASARNKVIFMAWYPQSRNDTLALAHRFEYNPASSTHPTHTACKQSTV